MKRNFCQPEAPSTSAASNVSVGKDKVPASSMIVITGIFIQIEAMMMVIMPNGTSTSQAICPCSWIKPTLIRKLLTSPTLALKNQRNWKPTRMGANIIGTISSVRSRLCPIVTRAINWDRDSDRA